MENYNYNSDRRFFQRFDTSLPVVIMGEDFNLEVKTKNISGGGFYCLSTRFIPLLTKFSVKMIVPLIVKNKKVKKEIECQAVVVRINPEEESPGRNSYSLGCFFSDIRDKDRKIISEYLQQIFCASRN